MKRIPDAVTGVRPDHAHALFVEWLKTTNEMHAAIHQRRPDVMVVIRESHDKLQAYLIAVRAEQCATRSKLDAYLAAVRAAQRDRSVRQKMG